MNELQLLKDSSIEPTSEVIAKALGNVNDAYTKFISELEQYDVQVDWRYYNDGKAWLGKGLHKWTTIRGTKKEITVFWLSIWDGFFKVSFFIPGKYRADVVNLSLTKETKDKVMNSQQVGKLKFFSVIFDLHSSELFNDLYTLIDFKKSKK